MVVSVRTRPATGTPLFPGIYQSQPDFPHGDLWLPSAPGTPGVELAWREHWRPLVDSPRDAFLLRGETFFGPQEAEKILTDRYGPDWRTPDPDRRGTWDYLK